VNLAGSSPARGFVLAAAASGSGKTLLTLALLRHFRNQGLRLSAFKIGPDYIDPAFHARACAQPCYNLDAWAMGEASLAAVIARLQAADLVIGEGVMGLFDGAAPGPYGNGESSSAAIAKRHGLPVILILDVKGQGATAAAVLKGMMAADRKLEIAGVIFNNVGSARHEAILESACRPLELPILGNLPREPGLHLPERHLGLVQAGEHDDLEAFLERAAAFAAAHLDTTRLQDLAKSLAVRDTSAPGTFGLRPLGQRIAIARDRAFGFCYAHLLAQWRDSGAEVTFFSPLENEAPDSSCDAVYLPGGYPELHAGSLAAARKFLQGLNEAARRGAVIYGECGGYMVLGQGLVDRDGCRHSMTGLLPVESSFAEPKRVLGYRRAELAYDSPLGQRGQSFRGHEFHFAKSLSGEGLAPLFRCWDSSGQELPASGCRAGNVFGSFLHLIDEAA
jgi:cobyrinic acid a,c-diamide synthase